MDRLDSKLEAIIAKNAHKISDGGQLMFMTCVNSFTVGCNWGFLKKSTSNFRDALETLKTEKQNINFSRVSNGVLVECGVQYLYHVLDVLFEGNCPIKYQQLAERRKDELAIIEKWLKRVAKNASTLEYAKRVGNGYAIDCAIYGVNASHVIRTGGVDYPAFRVNLNELISILGTKPEFVNTKIGIATGDKGFSYAPIAQVYGNPEVQKAVFAASKISDANTGLFVKLWVQ